MFTSKPGSMVYYIHYTWLAIAMRLNLFSNFKFRLGVVSVLGIIFLSSPVFAQTPPSPDSDRAPTAQTSIPGTNIQQEQPLDDVGEWIVAVYRFGIGVAGILAVMMMMIGGFIWLMSAGSPERVNKGKDWIISAITGLILALFSYALLYTINPRITQNLSITLDPISSSGTGSGIGSESESGLSGDIALIKVDPSDPNSLRNQVMQNIRQTELEDADVSGLQSEVDSWLQNVDKQVKQHNATIKNVFVSPRPLTGQEIEEYAKQYGGSEIQFFSGVDGRGNVLVVYN